MSLDSTEENSVETKAVDGSVTSLVSVDVIGTFDLEHDLFETENISVAPAGCCRMSQSTSLHSSQLH